MTSRLITEIKKNKFTEQYSGKKPLVLRGCFDYLEVLDGKRFSNLLDSELISPPVLLRSFSSEEFRREMFREFSDPTYSISMARGGELADLREAQKSGYGSLAINYVSEYISEFLIELDHLANFFAYSYEVFIIEQPMNVEPVGIATPDDVFILQLEGRSKVTLDKEVGKLKSTYILLDDGSIFETSNKFSNKKRYFSQKDVINELITIELNPGDMLYIPGNTYYFNRSLDEFSVSCGITPNYQSFINILEDVIRYVDPAKLLEFTQCLSIPNSSAECKKQTVNKLSRMMEYFSNKEPEFFKIFPLVSTFYAENALNFNSQAPESEREAKPQLINLDDRINLPLTTIMRLSSNSAANEHYVLVNKRSYTLQGKCWGAFWKEVLKDRSFTVKNLAKTHNLSDLEQKQILDIISDCVMRGDFSVSIHGLKQAS